MIEVLWYGKKDESAHSVTIPYGSGFEDTAYSLAKALKRSGYKVVAVRHSMSRPPEPLDGFEDAYAEWRKEA